LGVRFYCYSIGGEHATCVNGNGVNPGLEDVVAVGVEYGIDKRKAEKVANEILEIVNNRLGRYLDL
jgi:serine/threonine-protein kinase HipA